MYITEIQPCEKGRRKVLFEEGGCLILYAKEIRQLNLCEGQDICEEEYQRILVEILGTRAKRRAMYLLQRMDQTESQLREKLARNEYPQEAIEIALDYVKRYHYIDDHRFCCSYIRVRQENKSRQKLKLELMQKGVDRDVIDNALEEAYEAQEEDMIRELLHKKQFLQKKDDPKECHKIFQFLMRRGFRAEEIRRVMRHIEDWEEE